MYAPLERGTAKVLLNTIMVVLSCIKYSSIKMGHYFLIHLQIINERGLLIHRLLTLILPTHKDTVILESVEKSSFKRKQPFPNPLIYNSVESFHETSKYVKNITRPRPGETLLNLPLHSISFVVELTLKMGTNQALYYFCGCCFQSPLFLNIKIRLSEGKVDV